MPWLRSMRFLRCEACGWRGGAASGEGATWRI